jgi:outer membrane protein assembly factor BamB
MPVPRQLTFLAATFAFAITFITSQLRAEDWPQWGGSDLGRNMVSTEKNLPDTFAPRDPTQNVRWMATLGNYISGNPTISGGKVFVGTDDAELEATGKVLWRLPIPVRQRDRLPQNAHYGEQRMGTCSSPAVVGNRVYVVTGDCQMMCLDANGMADGNDGPFKDEAKYMAGPGNPPITLGKQDGDIIWSFDLIDQLGICPHDLTSCSVLVDGRFLYCVSCNGVDQPHERCLRPDAPSFICLDAQTGKLLATDTEGLGHRMWHCLWSPPSIGVVNGKKLVFFGGSDGICYAFDALTEVPREPIHFKKVWQYDCDPPNYRDPLGDGKKFNYYIGDKRKKYSTNKNDGKFLGPSEIISTPVFHDGGDITHTGCVWKYDAIERTIASVAIHDGLLYAVDLPGHVHCLDVATGKPYWVYETESETWGTPLVADGKVYLANKKGVTILATGKEPKLIANIPLGSPSYGTPVAANGTVFVTSQHSLWALQKGAPTNPTASTAEPGR